MNVSEKKKAKKAKLLMKNVIPKEYLDKEITPSYLPATNKTHVINDT